MPTTRASSRAPFRKLILRDRAGRSQHRAGVATVGAGVATVLGSDEAARRHHWRRAAGDHRVGPPGQYAWIAHDCRSVRLFAVSALRVASAATAAQGRAGCSRMPGAVRGNARLQRGAAQPRVDRPPQLLRDAASSRSSGRGGGAAGPQFAGGARTEAARQGREGGTAAGGVGCVSGAPTVRAPRTLPRAHAGTRARALRRHASMGPCLAGSAMEPPTLAAGSTPVPVNLTARARLSPLQPARSPPRSNGARTRR